VCAVRAWKVVWYAGWRKGPHWARPCQSPVRFAGADATLLDLVDNILTKGVVIDAEVVLGLAGVDLVYVRLSALLVAVDKLRRVL
jgi:hypothetical protein